MLRWRKAIGAHPGEDEEKGTLLLFTALDIEQIGLIYAPMQVWINQGDIILLSLRDFQDDKADVIVKYTADEARNLKAYGELPENAKINETEAFGEEDDECTFDFGEDDGDLEIDDL